MGNANDWALLNFSWLFNYTSLAMVICSLAILISPLRKIRIGGEKAEPLMEKWKWFSIILCTTVATGILFWGMAEPLYHFSSPPKSLDIQAESKSAAIFSMSSIFMHWTFTPYAIYLIPSLLFSLAFFNFKKGYSISSLIFPNHKSLQNKWIENGIDAIALFALVSGMCASLGTGMLTLAGGIKEIFDLEGGFTLLALVCLAIVVSFLASAISGLFKGVKILSVWNLIIFIIILLIFMMCGPLIENMSLGYEGFKLYIQDFFFKSTFTGIEAGDDWPRKWTVFNWSNWMAWAPVTALFLGRIAYGRTVKEFLIYNWILPSLFGLVWMMIFSGTALNTQLNGELDLLVYIANNQPENIIYAVLRHFPFGQIIGIFFILAVFISFVTAADSSTIAMGALSTKGLNPDQADPPNSIKIIWGLIIGLMAFVMVSFSGIDGIKMISILGGFPILFLMLILVLSSISLIYSSYKNKS